MKKVKEAICCKYGKGAGDSKRDLGSSSYSVANVVYRLLYSWAYFIVENSGELCFLAPPSFFRGHFFKNGICLNCGPTLWGRMGDIYFPGTEVEVMAMVVAVVKEKRRQQLRHAHSAVGAKVAGFGSPRQ